jgi:hypothetical protein
LGSFFSVAFGVTGALEFFDVTLAVVATFLAFGVGRAELLGVSFDCLALLVSAAVSTLVFFLTFLADGAPVEGFAA